ncbi:MAG: HDOD domain-containing protein [Deltaproteobacteria bacterium]|nr:HDOD domain-containing protein [Deltaproteobacteria bacterium]
MNLDHVLARIAALPPMPGVAVQLLKAARDPDVDMANVARWIEHDPSMTANLLHFCNSPFYGLKRQVTSVRQAASILGMKQVVQMTLTVLSTGYLAPEQPGYALSYGDLWRNSVAAAVACELIATHSRYENPATAYTAGLLQDIGKIVLAEFVGAFKTRVYALAEEQSIGFDDAERRLVGASHAEVGALLLARWGFPEALVESVKFHHDPAGATLDPALSRLSHLADAITITAGIGMGMDGLAYRLDEEAARALGLSDPARVMSLMEEFALKLQKAESLFATVREPAPRTRNRCV